MISPFFAPIASGIVHIAACTVALGIYDTMQNSFSSLFKFELYSDISTPIPLPIRPNIIIHPPNNRYPFILFKLIDAPTNKKSII